MQRDPRVLRALESVLKQECKLYKQYSAILDEERVALVKMKSDRVLELSSRRAELAAMMEEAGAKRAELLRHFPEGDSIKLSEIIARHCDPDDAKRILPLARELKALAAATKKRAAEFKQITSFALDMVNGSLSIIWSARNGVSKLYTRSGAVEEKNLPPARAMTTLKEA